MPRLARPRRLRPRSPSGRAGLDGAGTRDLLAWRGRFAKDAHGQTSDASPRGSLERCDAIGSAAVNASSLPAAPADVLLVGGRIYLGGAPPALSDWLAVRDGRIAALGVGAFDRDLRGPRTRVVDVTGGTIVPGFQDAHVHP